MFATGTRDQRINFLAAQVMRRVRVANGLTFCYFFKEVDWSSRYSAQYSPSKTAYITKDLNFAINNQNCLKEDNQRLMGQIWIFEGVCSS